MDSHASARPRKQHSAIVDSDEETEIYDYRARLSEEQGETARSHKTARKRGSNQSDDDDGDAEQTNRIDADYDSSDDMEADGVSRHPYYNYATEKSDTHADAKLIFQRHRGTTSEHGMGSPLILSKSMTLPPSWIESDPSTINRTSSITSRTSRPSQLTKGNSGQQISQGKETFPSLQQHASVGRQSEQDPYIAADTHARSHQHHPGLPHEFKDPLLANQAVHGAGAGVGIGYGPAGLAKDEESIVSEVAAICEKIKTILDLRRSYLKVSLQCPGDNPKDDETWEIYPPAPEPVWNQNKARPVPAHDDGPDSTSSSLYIADPRSAAVAAATTKWGSAASMVGEERAPSSPTAKKSRKAGHDIGNDFDIDECHIPGKAHEDLSYGMDAGSVFQVYGPNQRPIANVPTLRDYYLALDTILDIASDGPAKSFAYRRLQYLEGRYNLYTLLNEYEEVADTKKVPHRDFYNVRKVDTHVHHSACMNQKHLLRFIKSKMKKCPDEVVIERDGKQLTLSEVFQSIGLTAYDLSIDTLDMHAHTDSFHRFDKFNLKYNPIGQSRLRDIFLKTDNFIKGRYLADITREVISDLESSKYQMVSNPDPN